MVGATIVYSGVTLALAGLAFMVKPVRRLRVTTRLRAAAVFGFGIVIMGMGFALPAAERRVTAPQSRLDEFAPAWQFNELHRLRIAASPERVFAAMKAVTADEILFFRTLTWIRRGGRPAPPSILNPSSEPLIDVATRSGFVRLVDDYPRELVLGTVVMAPPGTRGTLTPEVFRMTLPPGFALATMNFLLAADGPAGTVISTETRVFATSPDARRRFAMYWRLIYPGSAIIRRMWLRAIAERAIAPTRSPMP
jgi:hypothetical protein